MMLLRSSSNPALNSFSGLQPESEFNSRRCLQSTQLNVAGNGDGKWVHHDVQPRLGRTLSEADIHNPLFNGIPRRQWLRRDSNSSEPHRKLCTEDFLSKGLLGEALGEEFEDSEAETAIGLQSAGHRYEESRDKFSAAIQTHSPEGPYFSGKRVQDLMGGRICEGNGLGLMCNRAVRGSKTELGSVNGGFGGEHGGGFSGGRGDAGRGGGFGSDSTNTDAYYKEMLQADPGNPLLLTNYARFLQEVQHDLEKAEEYYGRAILASPGDGNVLSLYADLIWNVHKNAPRAESYFDQVVDAAPNACNVLGSYAHFLWNAEDDEEDQDASRQQKMAPPTYFGSATTAAT